jgi:hypothetical protein
MSAVNRANAEALLAFFPKMSAAGYLRSFEKILSERDNDAIERTLLFRVLEILIAGNHYVTTLDLARPLYRCRIIDEDEIDCGRRGVHVNGEQVTYGYDAPNSREPPLGVPSEARNSLAGVSYLYLAEDAYTACCEIKAALPCYVSLAEFTLKRSLTVLDFADKTGIDNQLREQLQHSLSPDEVCDATILLAGLQYFFCRAKDENGYLTSQFIADHIRKAGFDGIRYRSAMADGNNITLFNCHKRYIEFVSSRLLYVVRNDLTIIDINAEQLLPVQSARDPCDGASIKAIKDETIRMLQRQGRHHA